MGSGEFYRGSTRINALCRELRRMKKITIGHEKIHKGENEGPNYYQDNEDEDVNRK
jgi:hypothetical protein